MKKSITIALTLMVLFAFRLQSQVEQPLKLIQTVPLAGLHDGDFDHFAVDPTGQWLFLAAEDDSAVEVIDLRTNKAVRKVPESRTPWLIEPILRGSLSSMETTRQARSQSFSRTDWIVVTEIPVDIKASHVPDPAVVPKSYGPQLEMPGQVTHHLRYLVYTVFHGKNQHRYRRAISPQGAQAHPA
jgi:hypothetical protein